MGKKNRNKKPAAAAAATEATVVAMNPDEDYPKSKFFFKAERYIKIKSYEEAIKLYSKGIINDSCIHCITQYAFWLPKIGNNGHEAVPFAYEGAIRGSVKCIVLLRKYATISNEHWSLDRYWEKYYEKRMKEYSRCCANEEDTKNLEKNHCFGCKTVESDTNNVVLKRCDGCNHYSYCSTACQSKHFRNGHAGECRQLRILKQYHRPHRENIRDRLINGEDPKNIPELQQLRYQLGLDKPLSEYVYDNLVKKVKPWKLVRPKMKDGTVWIGSLPGPM